MRIFTLFAALTLSAPSAIAQTDAKGEWSFPTSVKSLCIDREQSIVSMYKAEVTQNRLADAAKNEGKRQYMELANSIREARISIEQSWERLGCAGILYPKK